MPFSFGNCPPQTPPARRSPLRAFPRPRQVLRRRSFGPEHRRGHFRRRFSRRRRLRHRLRDGLRGFATIFSASAAASATAASATAVSAAPGDSITSTLTSAAASGFHSHNLRDYSRLHSARSSRRRPARAWSRPWHSGVLYAFFWSAKRCIQGGLAPPESCKPVHCDAPPCRLAVAAGPLDRRHC